MITPDIEIYIKNINNSELLAWLNTHFTTIDINLEASSLSKKKSISGTLSREGNKIPIVVTPCAAGKSYCSVWFKSSETPWDNDEACALSLLEMYDLEVRCAAHSWQEGEDEAGEYWNAITRNEKKLIRWG